MTENKKDWGKVREEILRENTETQNDIEDNEEDDMVLTKGALDHPSYEDLEQKLTLAEQQAHENWEKSVRAAAEVENIRRRAERDVANAYKYSLEKFSTSLLPVADSLEQALQLAVTQDDKPMQDGIDLTIKLFLDVLDKNGVKQINPIGEVFNPTFHEAISMQPDANAEPNTVLSVFQKGYVLNDRVIRPARVIVTKA